MLDYLTATVIGVIFEVKSSQVNEKPASDVEPECARDRVKLSSFTNPTVNKHGTMLKRRSTCKVVFSSVLQSLKMAAKHRSVKSFDASDPLSFKRSPTPHLIISNETPTDTEREQVEEALRAEYALLESTRLLLSHCNPSDTKEHERIHWKIAESNLFIHQHGAVLSPVRMLPPEILHHIFLYCLSYPVSLRNCKWRNKPYAVSQVCRRWRSVALATPKLWDQLPMINFDKRGAYAEKDDIDMLDEYLQRSRDEDLWAFIILSNDRSTGRRRTAEELILRHKHRFVALVLGMSSNQPTLGDADLTNTDMNMVQWPRLRRLRLQAWPTPSADLAPTHRPTPNHLILPIFGPASTPVLDEIELDGLCPLTVAFPWKQITRYREYNVHQFGFLGDVLLNASSLQSLTLVDLCYGLPLSMPLAAPLTFPHLKSLRVRTISRQNPESFFEYIRVPVLEELRISSDGEFVIPRIASLIQRSCQATGVCIGSCSQLRKLCIRGPYDRLKHDRATHKYVRQGDLPALLRLTPYLEELDIDFPPLQDLFDMIVSQYRQPIVPELKRLVIHAKLEEVMGNETTLKVLARSRCEPRERHMQGGSGYMGFRQSRLETFRLVLDDWDSAFGAQAVLNDWSQGGHYGSDTIRRFASRTDSTVDSLGLEEVVVDESLLLDIWREELHRELPELEGGESKRRSSLRRKLTSAGLSTLDMLLTSIEEFDTAANLKAIYASRLHFSVLLLTKIQSHKLTMEEQASLQSRSKALSKKWETLMMSDLCNYNWGLKGLRSVVYVPNHSPLRNSPAVLKMVYGMNDQVDVTEPFWPIYS
ncbi:hypothetical protein CVT24_011949 [Panaeolus cyanescens]|uniref:F-box domain-containing protein n=1 Tax=Panaeolus cyanescens TaxID=181874 RepID=A0A409W5U0_9AGAR|nr:hypothetical protein CVT24_011949 [Panaeolus cyanescens]